mgnify:CR=1 FL=1
MKLTPRRILLIDLALHLIYCLDHKLKEEGKGYAELYQLRDRILPELKAELYGGAGVEW